jgi:ankyrin repeat protein
MGKASVLSALLLALAAVPLRAREAPAGATQPESPAHARPSLLREAAARGAADVCRELLDAGVPVDAVDDRGRTALHRAAIHGRTEVIHLLLQSGADVDAADARGGRPLHEAATWGHPEAARLLLASGADVNATDYGGWTPLHLAAYRKKGDVFRLCMAEGADVNARDGYGRSALHCVAQMGGREECRLLLENGAVVDMQDVRRVTPLREALAAGHLGIAEDLIEAGADIEVLDDSGLTIPLAVVMSGDAEAVALLLRHGVEAGAPGRRYGDRLLNAAASGGHVAVMEVLLAHGAGVNRRDGPGDTALQEAVDYRQAEAVGFLIERGADVNVRDAEGRTPLLKAEGGYGSPEIAELLRRAGAQHDIFGAAKVGRLGRVRALIAANPDLISAEDADGRTPLCVAAEEGHADIVGFLLDNGAAAQVRPPHVQPLMAAARSGSAETFRLLAARSAELDLKTERGRAVLEEALGYYGNPVAAHLLVLAAEAGVTFEGGRTPLHLAAALEKPLCIEALAAAGVDLNARDDAGRTPLHLASEAYWPATAQALLDAGADPNLTDDGGETPIGIAAGDPESQTLVGLVRGGADPNLFAPANPSPLHRALYAGEEEAAALLAAEGARHDVFTASALNDVEALSVLLEADPTVHARRDADGAPPLHWAASRGCLQAAALLREHGADVNAVDRKGATALGKAALTGHEDVCRALLAAGAKHTLGTACYLGDTEAVAALVTEDPRRAGSRDRNGLVALVVAAEQGDADCVRILLAHGADVGDPDAGYALFVACRDGHREVAELLLEAGVDTEFPPIGVTTALYEAASQGHLEIARALLEHGASADPQVLYPIESPAEAASANGHADVARLIAEYELKQRPGDR